MKRQAKLTSQEQQLPEHKSQQTAAHEFASTEALLRYDAERTNVPPAVAQRLDESIQSQPRPARSLWRRLLGR